MVLKPAAAAVNVLGLDVLESHPRPTESETLGMGPVIWVSGNPSGDLVHWSRVFAEQCIGGAHVN